MLICIIDDTGKSEFDLQVTTIREALSLIQLQKGQEFVTKIVENKYKYIIETSDKDYVALQPEVILSDLGDARYLFIVQDVDGELPAAAATAIWASVVTSATAAGASAGVAVALGEAAVLMATAALTIGISMGLQMLMSALSPTPEFSKDPAATQNKSNLFNGAPIIRDQGGSVPLIFGNPYAGAVLISSGAFTEEVAV